MHGFAVVIDLTNSYEDNVSQVQHWMEHIEGTRRGANVVHLFGTKADHPNAKISFVQGCNLAAQFKLAHYSEMSAKTGNGVHDAFDDLAYHVLCVEENRPRDFASRALCSQLAGELQCFAEGWTYETAGKWPKRAQIQGMALMLALHQCDIPLGFWVSNLCRCAMAEVGMLEHVFSGWGERTYRAFLPIAGASVPALALAVFDEEPHLRAANIEWVTGQVEAWPETLGAAAATVGSVYDHLAGQVEAVDSETLSSSAPVLNQRVAAALAEVVCPVMFRALTHESVTEHLEACSTGEIRELVEEFPKFKERITLLNTALEMQCKSFGDGGMRQSTVLTVTHHVVAVANASAATFQPNAPLLEQLAQLYTQIDTAVNNHLSDALLATWERIQACSQDISIMCETLATKTLSQRAMERLASLHPGPLEGSLCEAIEGCATGEQIMLRVMMPLLGQVSSDLSWSRRNTTTTTTTTTIANTVDSTN
eukprot:TRINITY_DN4008_c0_g1_i10.p1 TRINITY_DN4008_c0_g1~~TRINITY_DN4008_c0_g1_i10.p1  ORF type:complete len:481 (-),score=115.56 TRINITY_DN4008_c0_g1_i10:1026-2468(-)